MALADALRMFYPGKYLTADNDALTEQTADAGGSTTTIVDSALTQAADYWNGAVGFFEADTTTAALRGQYFHVEDFDADTDTLTLYHELPAAPAAGDTYRLVLGGKWRSSYEVPGMTASAPSNCTGCTMKHVAYENGTGNGTLYYDADDDTLAWKAPSGTTGAAVDVSGGDGDYVCYDDDGSKWVEVTVDYSELPVADANDTIALTQPTAILIPDAEGAETTAGKTRYYAVPIKNTDGADTLYDVFAYLVKEVSSAADTTTTTLEDGGGTYPATLGLTSAANYPSSGWLYNSTKNDCRYYYNKSGNNVRCLDPGAGLRGKTSAAWEVGDAIQLMPDIDIGAGAPGVGEEFEDPANETTAPSGVTFSCPVTAGAGISLGDMAAAEVEVIWIREVIVAGARAKATALSQIRFQLDIGG